MYLYNLYQKFSGKFSKLMYRVDLIYVDRSYSTSSTTEVQKGNFVKISNKRFSKVKIYCYYPIVRQYINKKKNARKNKEKRGKYFCLAMNTRDSFHDGKYHICYKC